MEDWAIIAGNAVFIHQFCKIGQHAIIVSTARQDVPPYALVAREPARFCGINTRGLQKRNFSSETMAQIKEIYRIIYAQGLNLSEALEEVLKKIPASAERTHIVDFIRGSERGIVKK